MYLLRKGPKCLTLSDNVPDMEDLNVSLVHKGTYMYIGKYKGVIIITSLLNSIGKSLLTTVLIILTVISPETP